MIKQLGRDNQLLQDKIKDLTLNKKTLEDKIKELQEENNNLLLLKLNLDFYPATATINNYYKSNQKLCD